MWRRVIVCQHQKSREKLRSPQEAAADLRKLHEKLELFPGCHLGMWTNGHEEFFVRVEETKFEARPINIGAWPAPGERTEDILREGGATQVAADPDDLEAAFGRCIQYLTKNLLLGANAFKPLGALLLAKLYDETRPEDHRRVWIRGEEPYEADGQDAIRQRVISCFEDARALQSDLLEHGWDLGYLKLRTDGASRHRACPLLLSRQFAEKPHRCVSVRSSLHHGRQRGPVPDALERRGDDSGDAQPRIGR